MKVSLALITLLAKIERLFVSFSLPARMWEPLRMLAHRLAEVVQEIAVLTTVFAPLEHVPVWKMLAILKLAPWLFLAGYLFKIFADSGPETSRGRYTWLIFLLGFLLTVYGIPHLFWILLV